MSTGVQSRGSLGVVDLSATLPVSGLVAFDEGSCSGGPPTTPQHWVQGMLEEWLELAWGDDNVWTDDIETRLETMWECIDDPHESLDL